MSRDASRLQILEQRAAELRERLQRIERDRNHGEAPLEADFAEQAVQRQNDEVLDGLAAALRQELPDIERALERIRAGQGEICASCGGPIAAARLAAQPQASLCARCA